MQRLGLICSVLVLLVGVMLLMGCEGAGPSATTGAAAGYVYYSPTTNTYILSGQYPPPAGFRPVAGALVRIEGLPGAECLTNNFGFYKIMDIPPGIWTITVIVNGKVVISIQIRIVAGQITWGTGHIEGGG